MIQTVSDIFRIPFNPDESGCVINLFSFFLCKIKHELATGKVSFDGFTSIAGHFLEEEDAEAMQQELKEAFRLYDREGNGYITTR